MLRKIFSDNFRLSISNKRNFFRYRRSLIASSTMISGIGAMILLAAGYNQAAAFPCTQSTHTLNSTGIQCINGVSNLTVNGSGSIVPINNNVIGVELSRSGLSGSGGGSIGTSLETRTVTVTNPDGDDDTDDSYTYRVLQKDGQDITYDNGKLVYVNDQNQFVDAAQNGSPLSNNVLDTIFASYFSDGQPGAAVGDVTLNNSANLSTGNATGLKATASGGNGGTGGVSHYFFYSKGKRGGDGKNGGSVSVINSGTISTTGTDKHGIHAKSQAGHGGDGGGSWAVFVSDPGPGGDGGTGGTVIVDLNANSNITTTGVGGHGVLAESIGGTGGHGGDGASAVSLGNSGGSGGAGGVVTVTNNGYIRTTNREAHGIYALSKGGVGGSGSDSGGIVAIGGKGGGFASGSTVTVNNNGTIITEGYNSYGVLALSLGGGGGDGGSAGGLFSFGGDAGSGGHGGNVFYNQNGGSVTTSGNKSSAVVAQSIGGGGGNGGNAVAVSYGFSVAVGGKGGRGGDGKNVTMNIQNPASQITTTGNEASGLVGQSLGGGGGSGGYAVSIAVGESFSAAVGVGGSGGDGGAGGIVNITNYAGISTGYVDANGNHIGERSYGIFGQSVGGGGGTGGLAVAGAMSGTASASVAIGGSGGSGGGSNTVTINNYGQIETDGHGAHGIFGQSVGGGGGSGGASVAASISGSASVNVGLGGSGGSGGSSQKVTINNYNTIGTTGNNAHGILGQSVGGGGGSGGLSVAAGFSGTATIGVSLGGNGATGGNGHQVAITNTGEIITTGNSSIGVAAQSIGGGGGDGGFSFAGSLSGGGSVTVGLGGAGANGGSGSRVDLVNSGNITTTGDNSYGLLAQSVGGGGGIGGGTFNLSGSAGIAAGAVSVGLGGDGGAGNNAGEVFVTNSGQILTGGNNSHAIVAQSLGGGGGAGGWSAAVSGAIGAKGSASVAVSLGGTGGSGSTARSVSVTNTGPLLYTEGEDAYGILAQSVGGGGGTGGFSGAGAFSFSGKNGSGSVAVSLGGQGGQGGTGGSVAVDSTGNITTLNNRGHGIVAQSLGGGGGAGGGSVSLAAAASGSGSAISAGVSLGGSGGNGGTAGRVTVLSNGDISTSGDDAYGILAQSIGGSGGTGGFSVAGSLGWGENASGSVAVSLGGSGGTGATSDKVAVGGTFDASGNFQADAITGTIRTGGDRSHGLVAQSIGGSGGAGGFSGAISGGVSSAQSRSVSLAVTLGGFGGAGGTAKDVHVASDADIYTSGDHSYGILAQSIGGSGGTGGGSMSGSFGGTKSINPSISIGGFGGAGARAGVVNVTNTGAIVTGDLVNSANGQFSHGILAQSIGGNGGAAGWSGAISFSGSESYNASVSIGGLGGNGTTGNTVNVDNDGIIIVSGDRSNGIMAQSIGGGGGTGGDTGLDKDVWGENVIGDGVVTKVINGNSDEIDAGAGGAYSGSTGANTMSLSVSVGGFGGTGGHGGAVNVTNDGYIYTFGTSGHGIYAQSVGGGGGAGGVSTAAAGAVKASNAGSFAISVGGFGGAGGNGGVVTVNNNGQVITTGPGAFGVFAQSVGGGGGDGGDSRGFTLQRKADIKDVAPAKQFAATVGGFGGAAGNGGAVNVTNDGEIKTYGANSFAIFAQSVGGGGGVGGMSKTSNEELSALFENDQKARFKKWKIAVGGFGGAGGDGGDVTVTNNQGSLVTHGDGATAIYAQSVGGGGGDGGRADTGFSGDISIGGWGGNSGDGGVVTVDNNGDISTSGSMAYGIFAQSIGGGGGNGGNADFGSIRTLRNEIIKSVRKEGSASGGLKKFLKDFFKPTFGVAVGGFAGAAGDGGNVFVTNNGDIVTTGDLSHGIYAQSVGGGGGTGGTAHLSNVGKVGIGGRGGASGDGGEVTVTNNGNIFTTGAGAYGIFAQSVGGGGGAAGDTVLGVEGFGVSVAQLWDTLPDDVQAQLTPQQIVDFFNPGDGDGKKVTVNSNGLIYVQGGNSDDPEERAGSIGIFAQSVGGGGGIVGQTVEISEAEIGVDLDGDGLATGTVDVQSGYAFAGSVGGSGKGGEVVVNHTGSIISPSLNGIGIFAQSVGGDGGSNITINLASAGDITLPDGSVVAGGVIMGGVLADDGSGNAAAIIIDGGKDNTINLGAGTRVFALSDRAIIARDGLDDNGVAVVVGNETVNNSGLVIGIVDVGTGNNAFNNEDGGEFRTSSYVNLGANTNLLTNKSGGTINPYGQEVAGTTALSGGFVQHTGGQYLVDASFDYSGNNFEETDLINVSGGVELQGLVVPNLLYLANDNDQLILTSGTGPATVNGVNGSFVDPVQNPLVAGQLDVQDTLVVDYGLRFNENNPSGTNGSVWLTINSVDFSLTGFTPNQTSTGDHFNDIIMKSNIGANQSLAAVIADIANLPNTAEARELLASTLDSLHSEPYLAQQMATLFSDLNFKSNMTKCSASDAATYIVNGNCIWGQVTVNRFEKGRTWANIGLHYDVEQISGGYQKALSENTIAGVSLQYGHGDMTVDERLRSEFFKSAKAGAFVKYQHGNFQLSLGGNYGYGWYDKNMRYVHYPRVGAVDGRLGDRELVRLMAEGESAVLSYGAQIQAAYTHRIDNFYLKPFVELSLNHMKFDKFSEKGLEGLNLLLSDTDNTIFSAMPGLEIGGNIRLDNGLSIRPYVALGAIFFDDATLSTNTRFEGSPSDIEPYRITSEFDDVVGTVKAGVDLLHEDQGIDLKLKYEGKFSDNIEEHSGSVNFSVKF